MGKLKMVDRKGQFAKHVVEQFMGKKMVKVAKVEQLADVMLNLESFLNKQLWAMTELLSLWAMTELLSLWAMTELLSPRWAPLSTSVVGSSAWLCC